MTDLQRLDAALEPTLERLGIAPLGILLELEAQWERLAGDLWQGRSKPVLLRRGELIVEADPPSVVRLLEYATGDLLRRIDRHFGREVVAVVRVVPKRST